MPELDAAVRSMDHDTDGAPAFVVPTVRRLFDELEARQIRYCHWKSNSRLAAVLAGRADIDILVDRRDATRFHATLPELGFKWARSYAALDHPGLFHALALDETTGQTLDLHPYHAVVSGDSFVKSYRFPVERLLLDETRTVLGVRVPPAAAELVLFAFRIVLKHVSPVEIWMVSRHYQEVGAELAWLRAAATADQVEAILAHSFPTIEPALFRRLIEALADERAQWYERARWRRVALGWRVAWRLRHLRRLGLVQGMISRTWRVGALALYRVGRRRDLIPLTSGAIVALVGPKATGKSTLGRELKKRLGHSLWVVRIHAGKPPPTLLSCVPALFLPLARMLVPQERAGEYYKPERRSARSYSLLYVLRAALIAHDRRRLLTRAYRLAAGGAIVISDRYPSSSASTPDSSCFDQDAVANAGSRLKRWLMVKERQCYSDLPQPQLVLRLVAPLERAVERDATRKKADPPNAEAICRRRDLEADAEFPGVPVMTIDTDQSLDETVLAVVRAVWRSLG
jgi:thymidylate kinase